MSSDATSLHDIEKYIDIVIILSSTFHGYYGYYFAADNQGLGVT